MRVTIDLGRSGLFDIVNVGWIDPRELEAKIKEIIDKVLVAWQNKHRETLVYAFSIRIANTPLDPPSSNSLLENIKHLEEIDFHIGMAYMSSDLERIAQLAQKAISTALEVKRQAEEQGKQLTKTLRRGVR